MPSFMTFRTLGDTPESITISQSSGEIAPQITAVFLIDSDDVNPVPPSLTVTIAGIPFTGVLHKSALAFNASGKHTLTVTYIHPLFKKLLNGFGQDILYISCPKAVFDQMLKDAVNQEHIIMKHRESNEYGNNGWTPVSIIKDIFALIEERVNINFINFDMSSTTVQYQAGSDFLSFIQGTLPSLHGLTYNYTINANGILDITLLSAPAATITSTSIPAESLAFGKDYNAEYTGYKFTGGNAKPILTEYKNIKIVPISSKTEEERTVTTKNATVITRGDKTITMAALTPIRDNIPNTVIKKTKKLFDFKDEEFQVDNETIETRGATYDSRNKNPNEGRLQLEDTTYHYENSNPLTYEKSRSTGFTKLTSGLVSVYGVSISESASIGMVYYLLDNLQVISHEDREKQNPAVGTILYSGMTSFLQYKKEEEHIVYTTEKDSTKDYPEGTILRNSSSTTERCYQFTARGFGVTTSTRWFSCTEPIKDVLNEIAALYTSVQAEVALKYPSVPNPLITLYAPTVKDQIISSTEKEILKMTAKGTYRWKETTLKMEMASGKYDAVTQENVIPGGRIPSEPTKYRTQQLIKFFGDMGNAKIITPLSVEIQTNNRTHFLSCCDLIKGTIKRPHTPLEVSNLSHPVFNGESFLNGKVTGWSGKWSGDGKEEYSATVSL